MANAILAGSPQETTTRLERGVEILEERYNEVEHVAGETWSVPSSNLLVGTYHVRLERFPEQLSQHYTGRSAE